MPRQKRRRRTRRVKVLRVIDGDTVRAQYRLFHFIGRGKPFSVRLYGIDAPEMSQPGGEASRKHLRRLVGWRPSMRMEISDEDRYGRTIGLLYRGRGERGRRNSLNLKMVRSGQAYCYTQYGGKELGFDRAEEEARRKRRGVWRRGSRAQRPWDYRQGRSSRGDREGGGGRRRGGCFKLLLFTLAVAAMLGVVAYNAGPELILAPLIRILAGIIW